VNSFLAPGQDGFTTFRNGTAYTTGPVDVDALEAYIAAHSPISPPPANHGTQIG
jgi:5'-nucleotidase